MRSVAYNLARRSIVSIKQLFLMRTVPWRERTASALAVTDWWLCRRRSASAPAYQNNVYKLHRPP